MISVQTILEGQHDAACFSKLCRLCGNMKSPAISIIDESSLAGYHNIINYHFKDIQVSKNDILPLKLCCDCAEFITSWHRFHNECIQINEALSSVVNKFQNNFTESEVCYVFVDTNETTMKKTVESSNIKLSSSPPPSASEEWSSAAKCNKCGSVFLKSKVESVKNRGTCYSCYSKMTKNLKNVKNTSTVSPIFQNYLVTDENKQSYFLCDLCNFSCEPFTDVFAHHYKTEHPQANLYLSFANETDDPLKKFVHEKNGVRSYQCDHCQMSCISRNVFVEHYAEHGDRTALETGTLMIEFKDDKFRCAVCQKSFVNLKAAKSHLQNVHREKKHRCNVCHKMFTSKYKARIHEQRHLKLKPFMCDICGRGFVNKGNMENHLKKNLCSKYNCVWCCQSFKNKASLASHLIQCDQPKASSSINEMKVESDSSERNNFIGESFRYKCDKCKKKFKSKCLLRIHIIDEFELTPHRCHICNRRFTTAARLNKHLSLCNKSILDENQCDDFSLIVRANNESFGCKLCGRTFRKIGYLRQHFRLHQNTKPYVCHFCGKCYALKASFRSHMLTEMNLRKYACSVCGKRYNSSSHLTAHIKKHHRLREFKCNTCDKEFAYERDLKEHENTHDETKPYFCDKCGGFFKTERYLKVHGERCGISKQ